MKKGFLIVMSVVLVLMCAPSYAADNGLEYEIAMTETGIEVIGRVSEAAEEEILFRVLRYSEPPVNLEKDLIYMEQQNVSADGTFTFSCVLPDGGQWAEEEFIPAQYTVSLGAFKLGIQISEIFTYYGVEYQEEVIAQINQAKSDSSIEGLTEIMAQLYEKNVIYADAYEELIQSGGDFGEIAQRIISMPAVENLQGYVQQLNQSATIQMLFDTAEEKLVDFISDASHQEYLGIVNSSALSAFQLLKNSYGALIGTTYQNLMKQGESEEAFELAVISVGLKYAGSFGDVETLLKENEKVLGIQYSQYQLTNAELLTLAGMEIHKLSDVKQRLDEIVSNRDKGSGGSSGGGSGSSGGGSFGSSHGTSSGGISVIGGGTVPPGNTENTQVINPFLDLADYRWAEQSIVTLYQKKIISGRSAEIFDPAAAVTREEFVKMLVSASGINVNETAEPTFTDVSKDSWYYPYIKTAVNAGVIIGDESGRFGVGQPITRQDIAVILARVYYADTRPDRVDESICNDYYSIAEYAKESVAIIREAGIMIGYEDGNFLPQANATRAETAVLIARVMELVRSGGVEVNG